MELKEQIDKSRIPAHVAVIMDGNGRWARKRGFARTLGHEKGVDAVRNTVEAAAELGIGYLTLYAFSTENWNRPKYEIDALMRILVDSIHGEMKTLMKNNIRLTAIGDLKSLPPKSYRELMLAISDTSTNTGLTMILALSYSSRWELLEVARSIARKVESKELKPDQIELKTFTSLLATADIPDPELLIRTSGEYRVSNFLLWQIAYTELYFTQTLWPDFGKEEFYKAILDFQHRERRFGLTSEQLNELEGKLRT
ncbi:MAG: isoprenyl transferase [Bacteroidales bacterium]|jgi:undecaprenyl diphosphate synthase|nr:isoprenyl transferase [Bacteroidales bacterium]